MFIVDVYCSQLLHYALCSPLEVSLFILLAFDGPYSSCSSFTSNSCFTFSPPCCQASGVYHVLVGTISVTTCKYYQHKEKVELQRIVTMFYPQVMAIVKIAGKGKFHN